MSWLPSKLHTLTALPACLRAHLPRACAQIDRDGYHVEGMLMEPVMGEGNPGVAITREFYDKARSLTDECVGLARLRVSTRSVSALTLLLVPGSGACCWWTRSRLASAPPAP